MNGKRLLRRLPCEWYELGAAEHWLGDMARAGWQLERLTRAWAVFRRGEPQACRFRFYPCRGGTQVPDDGQKELFGEMGWEFVAMQRGGFAVYRCADPAAPELCTDPVVEADAYRRVYRELRSRFLWQLVYPVLYVGVNRLVLMRPGRSGLTLVHLFGGGFELLAALLLLFVVLLVGAARSFRCIRALRGRLAQGVPIDHEAPYPRRRRFFSQQGGEWLVLTVVLLLLVWINVRDGQPVDSLPAPVPAPLLAELEGGNAAALRMESSAETRATLLAECFCETRQFAYEEAGVIWLGSDYIRVRAQWMADSLFLALVAEVESEGADASVFGRAVRSDPFLPGSERFDRIACFQRQRDFPDASLKEWQLIVQRGRQVLSAAYTGGQPPERLLEEMDRTLRQFEADGTAALAAG